MATSKTLAPTNVTISIPAMADAPDASVFSNCVDKEADAINALNSNLRTNRTPAISSLSSDTDILSYGNGAYQVSLSASSDYLPTQWGTLIVMFSGVSYGVAIYVTTAGSMYVRHKKNASEWHNSWTAV